MVALISERCVVLPKRATVVSKVLIKTEIPIDLKLFWLPFLREKTRSSQSC